ncbi:hypothetical protein JZ751_027136 [Albula glossodonta]|uniref:Uncharacterized protein n=1 Tax=Albula glossodonta TaxID=121402 RepID=A0A8T2NFI8_9TELE|nr:hypothetical protein JZ751_027136 [Albula glossodonta]
MKRAASLNYLNSTGEEAFQVSDITELSAVSHSGEDEGKQGTELQQSGSVQSEMSMPRKHTHSDTHTHTHTPAAGIQREPSALILFRTFMMGKFSQSTTLFRKLVLQMFHCFRSACHFTLCCSTAFDRGLISPPIIFTSIY